MLTLALGIGAKVIIFGVVDAVLLYGVVAYNVGRRTRELGIRMAVGCSTRGALRLVLRQALTVVGFGVALGLPLAWLASRAMGSLLLTQSAADPISFLLAPTLLIVAASAAAYLPARRAARIDPVSALRHE